MNKGHQFVEAVKRFNSDYTNEAVEALKPLFPAVPAEAVDDLFGSILSTVKTRIGRFDFPCLFLDCEDEHGLTAQLEAMAHRLFREKSLDEADALMNAVYELKYHDFKKNPSSRYIKRVNFELASVCNLRCKFCTFRGGERETFLDVSLFEKLLGELIEFCPELPTLALYMSGESLQHPGFVEMLKIVAAAKANHPRFAPTVYLHTNGMLWSPKIHDRIMATGALTRVIWSIDGVDKETFEEMRAWAKYERVMDHFEYFLDHRGNVNGWVNNLQDESCIDRPQDDRMRTLFGRADRVMISPPKDLNKTGIAEKKYECTATGLCSYVFDTVVVSSGGGLSLCCVDYNVENEFGDLRTSTFGEIYLSAKRNQMLDKLYEHKRKALKGCRECTLLHASWMEGQAGIPSVSGELVDLERVVQDCWERISREFGHQNVALFGGGQHTTWLDTLLPDGAGPSVIAVVDESPILRPVFGALVPITPKDFDPSSVDAIVLSTDCWQEKMSARCRELFGHEIPLVDMYKELPKGPYRKNVF